MMNPRFEQHPAFSIVGCPQYGNPKILCPGLAWSRFNELRREHGLTECPRLAIAIEVYPPDFPNNDFSYSYMAGTVLENVPLELREHLFIKEVPAASYAVFHVKDNSVDNLKGSFECAYQKWLPYSEYRLSHRFDLERYKESPEKCFEIMLPVVKKNETA